MTSRCLFPQARNSNNLTEGGAQHGSRKTVSAVRRPLPRTPFNKPLQLTGVWTSGGSRGPQFSRRCARDVRYVGA